MKTNLSVEQLIKAKKFMAPKKPQRQVTISRTRKINILVIEKMLDYATVAHTYTEMWKAAKGVIHHKSSWIRYMHRV